MKLKCSDEKCAACMRLTAHQAFQENKISRLEGITTETLQNETGRRKNKKRKTRPSVNCVTTLSSQIQYNWSPCVVRKSNPGSSPCQSGETSTPGDGSGAWWRKNSQAGRAGASKPEFIKAKVHSQGGSMSMLWR